MKKEISLQDAWKKRLKLRAEGDNLHTGGGKLYAEAKQLWEEAIIEVYGNIMIEWKHNPKKDDYECHLENGEVFKP